MPVTRRPLLAALAGLPLLTTRSRAMTPGAETALIVVDVQNCFTPGGSLAVPDGDAVVPVINGLARHFANVVLTQDWHTPDHVSFASQHAGQQPFGTVQVPYGTQVLWPDHCVMGTEGAALHPALSIPHAQLVIRKGYNREVDSYSAFLEADRSTKTGLDGYLNSRGIRHVYLTGLATDFCVAWTALDARRLGFEATVIEDACRAIDLQGSLARAWAEMEAAGVRRIRSDAIG
ncbi:bifunctional nicotinamidase/pyrazinamidase [Muricoccus radiodurans]|uniref:bifunctional nicotinamidase/pyrazinamidase n=1 Tax=Muricoccus radiodurans TaxID=2231721 RepID=UPI003CEE366F